MPRHEVVEAVVVEPGEAVGAIGVGPDPAAERALRSRRASPWRLRSPGRVEFAVLAVLVAPGVVDLRDAGVERVFQQLAGIAPRRAPFGRTGRRPREAPGLDSPAGDGLCVRDGSLGLHRLKGEERHILGGNPGRAEPRRDCRGRQILGLYARQGLDIAGKDRIEGGGFGCRPELGADSTREVGVGRLPGLRLRIAEHGVAEFGENIGLLAAEQGGNSCRIDAAGLVQRDGERVGGALDHGRSRRGDHPLGEDGAVAGDAALEVIFLDQEETSQQSGSSRNGERFGRR